MALKFPGVIQPLLKHRVSHNVGDLNQEIICDSEVFTQTNLTSWDHCEGPVLFLVESLLSLLPSFCPHESLIKPEGCRWGGPSVLLPSPVLRQLHNTLSVKRCLLCTVSQASLLPQ